MKTIETLLASVAAEYGTAPADVFRDMQTYFDHLMEDEAFRRAWSEIPKPAEYSDVEYLLMLMIANAEI